jgi:hypothetical protein
MDGAIKMVQEHTFDVVLMDIIAGVVELKRLKKIREFDSQLQLLR